MRAQIIGLPGWLVYRGLRPWLPADHPWKSPLSLSAWTEGMLPLCRMLCRGIWISGLLFLISVIAVLKTWPAP